MRTVETRGWHEDERTAFGKVVAKRMANTQRAVSATTRSSPSIEGKGKQNPGGSDDVRWEKVIWGSEVGVRGMQTGDVPGWAELPTAWNASELTMVFKLRTQ